MVIFFLKLLCTVLTLISDSDYNYIRNGDECVPVGPEPIPADVCLGDPNQVYQGSSGWRKIPGNTCVGGSTKDAKVDKPCSQGMYNGNFKDGTNCHFLSDIAQPAEGKVVHQTVWNPVL
jgi:hypothetical protein